jgi:hypothetical protein
MRWNWYAYMHYLPDIAYFMQPQQTTFASTVMKSVLQTDASQASTSTSDLLNHLFPKSSASYTAKNLAAAHRVTAMFGMDDLIWNHISARDDGSILITPGELVSALGSTAFVIQIS